MIKLQTINKKNSLTNLRQLQIHNTIFFNLLKTKSLKRKKGKKSNKCNSKSSNKNKKSDNSNNRNLAKFSKRKFDNKSVKNSTK